MRYRSFEPEDFAADESFIDWVLHPDTGSEAFWTDWLHANPDKQKDVELARQLVLATAGRDPVPDPSEETIGRLWNGILERRQPLTLRKPFPWRISRIAAAAAGLLVLTTALYLFRSRQPVVYQTAYGESSRFSLPDGTLVSLNANSVLKVAGDWRRGEARHVWLEGEAYFQVSRQISAGTPVKFTVHTDDMHIEVKGTRFNVNTRTNQTRVVLSEGNVQLRLNDGGKQRIVRMKPGDWVGYSRKSGSLSLKHVADTTPLHSWKDNRWTLENTPMAEVARLIEETYGLPVHFGPDTLTHLRVTGIIPSDNLDDLLETLESILPVTVRKSDRKITVEGRP